MDLFKYQDKKYKEFNEKIVCNDKYPMIGIRIPILKELAKNEALNDYKTYLNAKHTYYEEYMLHGLILGYIKLPFNEILSLLDDYIPYINDWSLVDIPAMNLKCFKKNLDIGYKYILKLLKGKTFIRRFGIVLLLDYYVNDEYIDRVVELSLNIKTDSYYDTMALSWLIQVIFIKYKEKAIHLLKNIKDDKVVNKAISKICDSRRISIKDKEMIKEYRR